MSKLILVVDDEPILREILKDNLEEEGFKVIEAENGRQAFEIIKSQAIDCVVSDVRMPKGSGIELAENIHKMTGSKPKLILMSGYSDLNRDHAQKIGVLKIISKPFEPDIVVEEVCKAIGSS